MRQRTRKLIGTVALIVFVPLYALFAMTIAQVRVQDASTLTQTIFFAIAGLLWLIPAGILIKWMQRPDTGPASGG